MNKNKGFTLIELLVVIAIIGILSSVILASLSSTKNKGNDAKIKSQLKSMTNQALLFIGTPGTPYIVPAGASPTSSNAAFGTLFNDTIPANGSLYNLMSKLPANTKLYYGWDGKVTITGGKWFVAAGTSTGATCVDYSGFIRTWVGPARTTTTLFTAAFTKATVAGGYSCN